MPREIDPRDVARRNLALVHSKVGHNEKKNAELNMAAFLDFMHPEMDEETKRELIRDAE